VADDLDNTDDCTLVLRYLPGTAIRCVEGSESNVKITRPIDLVTADRLFQLRSSARAVTAHEAATLALRDKVVAVFGASSGIGRAATVMARAAGAHVAGFSVSRGVDIRNDRQVAAALRQVADEHGRIDAVLVTAGVLHRGALAEQPLTLIRETFDTNLLGAAIVAREAVPHLRATAGDLLLFTSSSYTRGRATYAAYSASKAAIVNLTQALADECAPDGIRVNCINPERTATPMRARAFPGEDASRMLDAADVAAATLSLLGSGVSGQVIDVAWPRQASAAALNVEAPRAPAVLPLPAA
jgi:ribitol-5-phosphate 2-dehydrogenase (NADP+) / D-ribitol-5-phosphate cytidylyltransferase